MDDFYLEQLKLMDDDYVRKEFKKDPFSIDEKIDLLQRELRIMTRARTEWSKKPIVKDETIEAYKVELGYWKNMRDQPNNHESNKDEQVDRETENTDLSEESIYKQILNTHHGTPAGKYAFFNYVKENGKYKNHEQVLEAANELHLKIMDNKLHENKGSLESSRSIFRKENPEWKSIVKEILKPFK